MLINKERTSRIVHTICGTIRYSRTILAPADRESSAKLKELYNTKSVVPVDDLLGVSALPFKMTYRLISEVAREAVSARSYADATEKIKHRFNIEISTSTVEHVTDFVGNIMFVYQCGQANIAKSLMPQKIDARRIRKQKDDVLYIETDGAMVYVRDKEQTEYDEPTPGWITGNLIEGVNKPGWTESKHAICFHARDLKYYYEENGERKTGRFKDILKSSPSKIRIIGTRIERRDCIGLIGKATAFQYHLLALAKRNDWEHCSRVVLLSDGAKWIKGVRKTVLNGKQVTQILDLYHAKENAWKFANSVKTGKNQKKKYADHLCNLIEEGKVDELLEELACYEDQKMPSGVPNLYTYIDNNRDCMDYPTYKKAGLFVGSGAMESANIYMMQDRMKLPGMRWKTSNGQYMLTLKSYMAAHSWKIVEKFLYDVCYSKISADSFNYQLIE